MRPSTTFASVSVGSRAALAVAGRARARAGAARPDAERAALVDVRDRAAAGADRVDVDHRHEQRIAGDPGVARGGLADPVLRDDPDVGRGAADVERDQPLAARRLARPRARRARPPPGPERSSVTGFCAAVSAEATPPFDIITCSFPGTPSSVERAREPLEVAAGRRADERVHAGGREALELAELRKDVGARRDERTGHLLRHDLGGPPLVLGVEVGEEEADGDRLDAGVLQRACRGPHLVLVQRLEDLARRRHDPLARDVSVPALHERPRLPGDVLHDRVVLRPLVAADVDDVAEPFRRQHPRLGPAVLEHRVRRDGRAVEDGVDLCRLDARVAAEVDEAGDHRPPGIVGRGADLVHVNGTRLRVVEHEVGEGAADVDPDNPHPGAILFRLSATVTHDGCACAALRAGR